MEAWRTGGIFSLSNAEKKDRLLFTFVRHGALDSQPGVRSHLHCSYPRLPKSSKLRDTKDHVSAPHFWVWGILLRDKTIKVYFRVKWEKDIYCFLFKIKHSQERECIGQE